MHKETNSPAAVSSAEYLYCQSNFELKHERQQASNNIWTYKAAIYS